MFVFVSAILLVCAVITGSVPGRSKASNPGIVSYPPAGKPILHLLNGTLMNNITDCPVDQTKSNNIHIVTIASPRYYTPDGLFPFYKETMDFYTSVHGYHNHIVDPTKVMEVYGTITPDSARGHIIASKSLVMLYKMREIYHEYGCSAHWVLFLDADVIMIDLTRTVESVIDAANTLMGGSKRQCEFIAQLSSATINTGVLMFKVSPHGEKIVSSWVDLHRDHANKGVTWQDDQGWIQYTYLKHLEHHYKRPLFVDCAINMGAVPGLLQANGGRISPNGLRNNCFAKNLYLYDLWDQFLRRANKNHHGTKYCILQGNTSEDRINLHDWNGDHFISSTTGEYSFIPGTGEYTRGGKHVLSSCTLYGTWLYHGKNFDLVNKEIKPRWEGMKQRFREIMAGNSSSRSGVSGDTRFRNYRSVHMFDFPDDVSTRDVCGPVVNKMLLGDALKNEWLAPSFRATQTSFLAEIGGA